MKTPLNFIITIDYFNGQVVKTRRSPLFEEGDLNLVEYGANELKTHQSGIGKVRIVRTYPETDSTGKNLYEESSRWFPFGQQIFLGSTNAIKEETNFGEPLIENQYVIYFRKQSIQSDEWRFNGILKIRNCTTFNITAIGVERYWKLDPPIFLNNLTHIGMLRAKNDDNVEGNYYDEVMTKEEIISRYNQIENRLWSFPDLQELLSSLQSS